MGWGDDENLEQLVQRQCENMTHMWLVSETGIDLHSCIQAKDEASEGFVGGTVKTKQPSLFQ